MEIGTHVFYEGAYGITVSEPVEEKKSRQDYYSKKRIEYTVTSVDVKWDDGETSSQNVDYLKIIPEDLLTAEFKAVQTAVNAKLNQAAALIREAGKLAETIGKTVVSCIDPGDDDEWPPSNDTIFDSGEIKAAMGAAGWRTSSWHC